MIVASKMPGEMACSCAVARSSVHPGLRRPIATSHQSVADTSRLPPLIADSTQSGTATSKPRPTSRPLNPAGATPITSAWRASSVRVRPIACGSPPIARDPERVAEHDLRRAARRVVGVRDEPPGRRRDAEHVEERARDEEAARGTHLAAVREVERGAAPGGDVREALLLAADLREDGVVERIVGGGAVAAGAVHVGDADAGEFPRPRDRQRSQPHGVDDLEDRGRGADAEREREDGNDREPGAAAQQACGVAEILSEAAEPDATVHVPGDLLHDHDVAELAASRGFGLGA